MQSPRALGNVTTVLAELGGQHAVARTNRAAMGSGSDWLLFIAPDQDHLSPALGILSQLTGTRPDVSIFYFDEAWPQAAGFNAQEVSLKPDFSPELLMSTNYVGWPVLMRRSLFRRLGGFDPNLAAAADHHLWLRAWDSGAVFARHPEVALPHRAPRTVPPSGHILACVADFCRAHRPALTAGLGLTPSSVRIDRRFAEYPEVTLVIPTRQSRPSGDPSAGAEPHIISLLDSLATCTWPMNRLNVLVGDDHDDHSTYARGAWPFQLDVVHTPRQPSQPFNYSRKMNSLWRRCESELLVFMNDDTRAIAKDWIEALMTYACDADIGAVGARLSFPSGRIQHAGVAGGLFGLAAHPWWGLMPDEPAYEDWPLLPRNWSMLTGAVLATRKSVMEEVDGFDEAFEIEFNDFDLCLKLVCQGYRIVYTPHAHLVHYEMESRGHSASPSHERHHFWHRWRDIIADDPMYHPRLSRDTFAIHPMDNVTDLKVSTSD
jgi:GT2 family glycosyltransferase